MQSPSPQQGPPRYPQYPQYPAQPPQPPTRAPLPGPVRVIDASTARVLSALAHGAIAFGLLGVGFVATLIVTAAVWLYGRRSPQVRFHSEQAGCYQCSVVLISMVLVTVTGATGGFSIFQAIHKASDWGTGTVAVIFLILFAIWFVASIGYGIFAALMVLAGKPFRYPIIGKRFERTP